MLCRKRSSGSQMRQLPHFTIGQASRPPGRAVVLSGHWRAFDRHVECLSRDFGWGCVVSLWEPRRRKRIEDVRCPAVKGLPDDIYHMLHHSFVGVLKMRRSIENLDRRLEASMKAIFESSDLLKRVQDDGF